MAKDKKKVSDTKKKKKLNPKILKAKVLERIVAPGNLSPTTGELASCGCGDTDSLPRHATC